MLLALLPALTLLAIEQTATTPTDWTQLYERGKIENATGDSLPYRLLKPEKMDSNERYPLVVFLHGAGERGNENNTQLYHIGKQFATPENLQKHPCFFVAPQCPNDKRWVEVDWALPEHTMPKDPSPQMQMVFDLIDKLAADLPVDKSRIYIMGLSMGGFGTWDAIQRRPDLFAAAIPICGGGDVAEAAKLKDLPIWAFHGEVDGVVLVKRTKDMIAAIEDAGGKPKMTIYPNVNHDSWVRTFVDPAMYDWLFAQKKP
jgi:predicted peptidase